MMLKREMCWFSLCAILVLTYLKTALCQERNVTPPSHRGPILQNVVAPQGENITLTFYKELKQEDVEYICNGIVLGTKTEEPFIFQSQINPGGLKPNQDGRFSIQLYHSQRNLTISLSIMNVQGIDEGDYLVEIAEKYDGDYHLTTYAANIDVWYPPGKAYCEIQISTIQTSDWLTVHCNAMVGSDDHGHLVCLQKSKRSPFLQPVHYDGYHMTAIFWMEPGIEISCCSANNDNMINPDSCKDFVYQPSVENVSSTNPYSKIPSFHPLTSTLSASNTGIPAGSEHRHPNGTIISISCVVILLVLLVAVVIGFLTWKLLRRRSRDSNEDAAKQPCVIPPGNSC